MKEIQKTYSNVKFKSNTLQKILEEFKRLFEIKNYDFNLKFDISYKANWEITEKVYKIQEFYNEYDKDSQIYSAFLMLEVVYKSNLIGSIFIFYSDNSTTVSINFLWESTSKKELNEFYLIVDNFSSLEKYEQNGYYNNDIEKNFISLDYIDEIRKMKNIDFDVTKLIRILEEINLAYNKWLYLSLLSLSRMLLDHIPPIFSYKSFNEVANNFDFWKSDKKIIITLQDLCRNLSDSELHSPITFKEVLPNRDTVNFSIPFNCLLKYIIKQLHKHHLK